MKVALCISGQLRMYKETMADLIKFKNHFDECDVFMVYDDLEKKEDIFNIIDKVKPVCVKQVHNLYNCNHSNMWYKIKECFKLCKNNYMNYDLVIRCRYDNYIRFSDSFKEICQKTVKPNTIYTSYNITFLNKFIFELFLRPVFVSDSFFMCDMKTMEKCTNFLEYALQSKNKCVYNKIGEVLFKEYLIKKKIKQKTLPINVDIYTLYHYPISHSFKRKYIENRSLSEFVIKQSSIFLNPILLFIICYILLEIKY